MGLVSHHQAYTSMFSQKCISESKRSPKPYGSGKANPVRKRGARERADDAHRCDKRIREGRKRVCAGKQSRFSCAISINPPQRPLLPRQKGKAPKEGDRHSLSPSFVSWLQFGYLRFPTRIEAQRSESGSEARSSRMSAR